MRGNYKWRQNDKLRERRERGQEKKEGGKIKGDQEKRYVEAG